MGTFKWNESPRLKDLSEEEVRSELPNRGVGNRIDHSKAWYSNSIYTAITTNSSLKRGEPVIDPNHEKTKTKTGFDWWSTYKPQ